MLTLIQYKTIKYRNCSEYDRHFFHKQTVDAISVISNKYNKFIYLKFKEKRFILICISSVVFERILGMPHDHPLLIGWVPLLGQLQGCHFYYTSQ